MQIGEYWGQESNIWTVVFSVYSLWTILLVSLSSDAQVLSMASTESRQENIRAEIIFFSLVILMAMACNLLITFALHKDHMEHKENKEANKNCDMNPHHV